MTNVVYIFGDIGKKFLAIFAGTGSTGTGSTGTGSTGTGSTGTGSTGTGSTGAGSTFLYPILKFLSNTTYFLSTRWQCDSHATECVCARARARVSACVCVTDRGKCILILQMT